MISPKHMFQLAKKAVMAYLDDYAMSMGAAISYYTIFSLAPLLVLVIAVAGAVFGREAVQGQVVEQLGGLIGSGGAEFIQGLVASASDTDKGLFAGLISVALLIVGATTVFAELQSALDRIWHVPESEKPSGVWAVIKARVLSFGLILGLAFLLLVSLVVSTGLAAFGAWASAVLPGGEVLLHVVQIVVSTVILTLLFAMIFKLMPTAPIAWRDVWAGAFVTALLFEVGKSLIGLYLGKSGFTETFAAAGSLVILLAWFYYAAQIFLLGAEFTKVYADEHGSLAGARAQEGTRQTAERGVPAEVPSSAAPGDSGQATPAGGAVSQPAHATGAAAPTSGSAARLTQEAPRPPVVVAREGDNAMAPQIVIATIQKDKGRLLAEFASVALVTLASVLMVRRRSNGPKRLRRS